MGNFTDRIPNIISVILVVIGFVLYFTSQFVVWLFWVSGEILFPTVYDVLLLGMSFILIGIVIYLLGLTRKLDRLVGRHA